MTQLLTVEQAARILKLKPDTLNQWRKRKKGPPYLQMVGTVRYDKDALEVWVTENTVMPE